MSRPGAVDGKDDIADLRPSFDTGLSGRLGYEYTGGSFMSSVSADLRRDRLKPPAEIQALE